MPSDQDAHGHPFATPQALHPASIVVGVGIRQFVQGLVLPAFAGAAAGPGLRLAWIAVGVAVTAGLTVRFLAWRRFRFSFDGEVLRIDEGILRRNHRSLDVRRIQQVEVDRSLLQRVLALASVRVETAGSGSGPEVELRVLPEADAQRLRAALRAGTAQATGQPAGTDAGAPLQHVSVWRIVLAAVTGTRLLVLPAVLLGAIELLGNRNGAVVEVVRNALDVGLLLVVVLFVPAMLMAAAAAGVLRDFDWTLRRHGNDLHVSRGLLSTREAVLPLQRVQRVEVRRNLIRRPLGYAQVRIHSAGGGTGEDRRVTVPLIADGEVSRLLAQVLPDAVDLPALVRHPPAARRRAVLRRVAVVALPGLLLALAPGVADRLRWLAVLLLLGAVTLGVVAYRHLAHGIGPHVLVSRHGALSVTTSLAPVVKVQAVSTRSTWFQRRLGVVTVTAHVAGPGGDVRVLDCGTARGDTLHRTLLAQAAYPVVTGGA